MDETIDTAPCFYLRFSDNGTLLSFNQTLCDELGYTKTELKNAHLDQVLTLASRIFFQTHWFPLLQLQQEVNELFVTFVRKNKTSLPVLVNSIRRQSDGQAVIICAGILISRRQQYEQELIAAKKAYEAALSTNAALTHSQDQLQQQATQLNTTIHRLGLHNDELKQINKVVTHDLQEPIRKLLFYAEQLRESSEVFTEDGIRYIERLQALTYKLRTIVSGLQRYIWLTELDMPLMPVDLNQLIMFAQKEVRQKHPDVTINFRSDPLPTITGNSEQLQAMIIHVLDNAVRFRKTEEDAVIDIRSVVLEQNNLQHLDNRYRYSNFVRLIITDNGIGFDPQNGKQIFSLFYKSSDSTGAGLGLTLTEHHHGTITAQSERGKGTTITITLPIEPHKDI
jgi:phosphoserine phosphatase RsbU/P